VTPLNRAAFELAAVKTGNVFVGNARVYVIVATVADVDGVVPAVNVIIPS
jgi:hypothetical protein